VAAEDNIQVGSSSLQNLLLAVFFSSQEIHERSRQPRLDGNFWTVLLVASRGNPGVHRMRTWEKGRGREGA
jgi:hypothetical protein